MRFYRPRLPTDAGCSGTESRMLRMFLPEQTALADDLVEDERNRRRDNRNTGPELRLPISTSPTHTHIVSRRPG